VRSDRPIAKSSPYRIELSSGQVLFREGDAATTAFLIERGSLRVTAERDGVPILLGNLHAGSLVGEMAVLDDSPRTATATALEFCVLTPVDRAQFGERLATADPVLRALLLSQLARYRNVLATFTGNRVSPPGALTAQHYAGDARDKIRLESHLREAIDKHTLELHLQPIVHIADGAVAGYEALVRWTHAEHGIVSPAEFIALAEETSLIVPIGEYVLREVCAVLRRLIERGRPHVPFVGLNVSGRQIDDPQFVDRVVSQAHAHAVAPSLLKVEITESLMLDYSKVEAFIARCHNAGIRVALDDFGTGYSSLSHLHRLTFDTLKLDQAFVRQLDDPRCLAIVRAIIVMTAALGCDIVAEGVETPAQLACLQELGCQFAQGYLIGKPRTIDTVLAAG
jgi:EAL domain-containing protein (putative c-di-GMP-specific phosphodiesterase class I)